MRKLILLSLALLSATASAKDTIAIMMPTGSHRTTDVSENIYQFVAEALLATKRFDVIERAQLDNMLSEAKFQNSGLVDEGTAAQLGKLSGASNIIVSTYSIADSYSSNNYGVTYNSKINYSLRMVDANNGKVIDTISLISNGSGTSGGNAVSDSLNDLKRKLFREISNKYPISGYIIKKIDNKQFMIDVGASVGLKVEDELQVVVFAEDFIHPVTGRVIKGEKSVVADIVVQSATDETAVVKFESGSLEKISIGAQVESKPKKKGLFESLNDSIR